MNSPKILRDTVFTVDPNGNGGNRRTAQIDQIITSQGYQISDITKNLYKISTTKLSKYVNGINFLLNHQFLIALDRKILRESGDFYQRCKYIFKNYSGRKILIWEATREQHYMVPYIAKENGFKIIAMPQNIESLSAGNVDPFTKKKLPDSFLNELKHLSLADEIFCISTEEKWLLNLFGIEANYLPYYPPAIILDNLLKIRNQRNSISNGRFLIMGTVSNPPTRLGMIELITKLKKIHKQIDFKIDLAGYETETLKEFCDDSFMTLHGTVSPEKLNELLLQTSAVLVYQKTGVGALTKIPEILIAGIPVIANITACRSAFAYSGIYCYEHDDELADLLSKQLEKPGLILRPQRAEEHLLNCLS